MNANILRLTAVALSLLAPVGAHSQGVIGGVNNGAEKGDQRIAVEIKSFTSPSMVTEFHSALGQFLLGSLNMKTGKLPEAEKALTGKLLIGPLRKLLGRAR